MSVSRSTVGMWETERCEPRGKNRAKLIKLYLRHFFPKEKTNVKASNGKASNGKASNGDAHNSKGGRHKVSVGRVQERLSEVDEFLLSMRVDAAARKVAEQSGFEFTSFREALVVFLYGMDNVPAKTIAQVLSGHE